MRKVRENARRAALLRLPVGVAGLAWMAVSRARSVERPDGLGSRTACRPVNGLALERGASLSGPAVVWLEKGASASTVIRYARRGFPLSFDDDVECADGGSDDRGGPA
jgi:hypothetical protein